MQKTIKIFIFLVLSLAFLLNSKILDDEFEFTEGSRSLQDDLPTLTFNQMQAHNQKIEENFTKNQEKIRLQNLNDENYEIEDFFMINNRLNNMVSISEPGLSDVYRNDILILVISSRSNKSLRDAIRETWAKGHGNVFFVVGKGYCKYDILVVWGGEKMRLIDDHAMKFSPSTPYAHIRTPPTALHRSQTRPPHQNSPRQLRHPTPNLPKISKQPRHPRLSHVFQKQNLSTSCHQQCHQ